MLIAAVATYYFVDKQEDSYKSTALLSTGIVDITGVNIEKENPFIQKFYIDMGFSKLMELIGSRRNVEFLTYRLLQHDMAPKGVNAETPFRSLVGKEEINFDYSAEEMTMLDTLLTHNLENLKYTLDNPRMEVIYKDLTEAYGYDYESLIKNNLVVSRKGDTDLLTIEFVSENPRLSHFAVNTFCNDFLRNYNFLEQEEEFSSVKFYKAQMDGKKHLLDSLQLQLKTYRNDNNIIDLKGESSTVIAQIKDLELDKENFIQQIPALKKNIEDLDRYLRENDQFSIADKADRLNSKTALINIRKQIGELQRQYIVSGYKDKSLRKRIELLRKEQEFQSKRLANLDQEQEEKLDKREEDLLTKRIDFELDYNYAVESVASINAELGRLRGKAGSFVSAEAYLRNMEQEIEITQNDYKQLVAKYNQEKRNLDNSILPVRIFQHAQLAEKPEPKLKAVLSGFAGVVSGTLASVIIFLLAFMDYSVNSPHKFKKFANLPLVGTLNKIKTKKLDMARLFASDNKDSKQAAFKESVRNLRYAVENSGGKKFLFTSTKEQEGKTFLIITLAHSLTLKNKRVLLVDTNFKNNSLTQMSQEGDSLLANNLIGDSPLGKDFEFRDGKDSLFSMENVDIIGNKRSFQSPSEVFADKDFDSFINRMSADYDYVFLESAAMNKYSDTKELVEYVDKVVAVFAAESEIKQVDKDSISFLKGLGAQFLGAVLNKVELKNLS
ncbi:MAG: hypothetical protein AAGG75_18430 [Bacteroidota bacterium]